ncbi:sterile alpha motif domain-containing protein 9 [Cololabis saira]|uniref:sterile alpha motif domain-containing protein 9 n=1 Tax=Cololabis saira TaxID=129043 RepID=UPI002AD26D69|nr:sterile alpha motif domain-containing protein 9 [Cololabis saira]
MDDDDDDDDDATKRSTSSCFSVTSDNSMHHPLSFRVDESSRNSPSAGTGKEEERPSSPGPSLTSYRSRTPPPNFMSDVPDKRNVVPTKAAPQLPDSGPQPKTAEHDLRLPPLMEDWTKDNVKDWLVVKLRVSAKIAQNLYDQECSGACLISFEKQDLIELGVPRAPALQIIKQVEKFRKHSQALEPGFRVPESHCELRQSELWKTAEMSPDLGESIETETVSSDSGFQSLSPAVQMLQMTRNKIRSLIVSKEPDIQYSVEPDKATVLQPQRPICQIRPFDKSSSSIYYTVDGLLPPMAGPSNLLDPVHEYYLLPSVNASEREILYEFTKELSSFAASCMNSRTNGTIHFGVNSQPDLQHGQIVGHKITSFNEYHRAFETSLSDFFEEKHTNAARMCIRPPNFIQVHHQNGTTSDKWVIEVDVVPAYSQTQDHMFYTLLTIASTEENQKCKSECLFVRDGPRSINILADSNHRVIQEQLKSLGEKVMNWASARKLAEEKVEDRPSPSHQGQRLKQLMTQGRDAFESSIQVIVVTDKCHSSQLEHMDFLKEMTLFAVLDFDPESDINGTCSFYRKDRIANLHYPHMYTTQDSLTAVIGKLNLFKQTSWIFCNGQKDEDSDRDKPLIPTEWLKKRSGEVSKMLTFLCNSDLISKDRLLVIFVLHSSVTNISSPVLETFCAIHRTLEGVDNVMCICKDATVFSHWKRLIEDRCMEDITNKCIYELSLNEISSTVKKLKEPQTQSSKRFLPSTGSSSVLLTKKDEELFTVLDILTENECENTEIETKDSFDDFKKRTEEDFYRGGQVTWWNFYLSEKKGSLPFIMRDKYNELYDLIRSGEDCTSQCTMINLFHHPGCGGTTLAMHVLWNLRRVFRCAVVKNNMAANNEIAVQVVKLLTYGKQEQTHYLPVLLLVDNWDDVEDLKQCILNVASDRQQRNHLKVIILNCERTQFPRENSRKSHIANVVIMNKLSATEQVLFSEKLQQLKDNHEKPETFYAFMIMTNNFSEAYITNLVSNIVQDLDATTPQGRLFSFLALLNTFVNGSYMSLSLCEELVGIKNTIWKREPFDDIMNPYSTLLITFTAEEHGTYQAVRFLHQMISSECLQILKQKDRLAVSEIAIDILHCDRIHKSAMGKDYLCQNIHSMLITRNKKVQGDDKDTLFSPLIEKICEEEGHEKIKEVFEKAIERFDRRATLPQALARHFYLKEKDFGSALRWALDAQGKNSNSYIADTVGQIYKSQLKNTIDESKPLTPEAFSECLILGSKAVKAFRDSQELAKTDEQLDPFDLHSRKRSTPYNTSGYVGETEVILILLDVITALPLSEVSDRHQRDRMQQFLKGHHSVSSLHRDQSNTTSGQFVSVLKEHERFLTSLKPRLKDIFSFFENYYTYLKSRSQERETADDRNKKKLSDFFKKYIQIFSSSEEEKASEKAGNPNLSLNQEVQDRRYYLETKRADSFAGLLQCLSEKSGTEMEHILKHWKFIFDKTTLRSVTDTLNFILANIVMHSIKPSSNLLKKYEELVDLLDKELQRAGTRSNVTELYYLSMLLMWPAKDRALESFAAYKHIGTYIASVKKSYNQRFSHVCSARSPVAHFFLGKSSGLKRIVSRSKLDRILERVSKQDSCDSQSGQPQNLHNLWQSGAAWNKPEVQKELLRVKGKSENREIYVNYGGSLKMVVRPVYLGDIRSGHSRDEVSFYLGFTMSGPVAYNIKYENDQ